MEELNLVYLSGIVKSYRPEGFISIGDGTPIQTFVLGKNLISYLGSRPIRNGERVLIIGSLQPGRITSEDEDDVRDCAIVLARQIQNLDDEKKPGFIIVPQSEREQ